MLDFFLFLFIEFAVSKSYQCGTNVDCSMVGTTLTVSGNGEMNDYVHICDEDGF